MRENPIRVTWSRASSCVASSLKAAITESPDDPGVDVTALSLSMTSGSGIGASGNPLETQVTNLEANGGLVFSQALLLDLVRTGMLRDEAYRVVQSASRTAWESARHLRDVALETRSCVFSEGE